MSTPKFTVSTTRHYDPLQGQLVMSREIITAISAWVANKNSNGEVTSLSSLNDEVNGIAIRYWVNRSDAEEFIEFTRNLLTSQGLDPSMFPVELSNI